MTWVLSVRPQRSLTREAGRAAHHQACDSSEEMGLLSLAEEQLLDVVAMCDFEDACALMEMDGCQTKKKVTKNSRYSGSGIVRAR